MSEPLAGRSAEEERKIRWVSRLGYWVIAALARTWRTEMRHDGEWPRVYGRRAPVVVVGWHGEMLPVIWIMRHFGLVGVAREHGDAEIMVRIAERLGFATSARGSSTRGGLRGLLTLVETLKQGKSVGLTPDGPKGPARVVQPGALIASLRSTCVIIPTGLHVSRCWRAKRSWDRFLVPLPFARVVLAFGAPFTPRAVDGRVADGEAERLVAAMLAAEKRAGA